MLTSSVMKVSYNFTTELFAHSFSLPFLSPRLGTLIPNTSFCTTENPLMESEDERVLADSIEKELKEVRTYELALFLVFLVCFILVRYPRKFLFLLLLLLLCFCFYSSWLE